VTSTSTPTAADVQATSPVPANVQMASRQFMATAERLPTLYSLDEQCEALLALLDNAESEEEQAELLARLDLNELLTQGKVEAYVAVIEQLQFLSDGRKAAARRLRDRSAVAESAAKRLKERLLEHMQRTDRQRIETQLFTIRRQLNPPSAEVYDEDAVPDEFVEIRTERHIRVRDVISHVKQTGEVVPGVTVSQKEGIRLS
jgi:hypothetical protein